MILLLKTHSIALFSLLVFSPVFLSISPESSVVFNRIIGDNYNWVVTVPISIIASLIFLTYNSRKVITTIPKFFLLFLVYLCISILILYFSGNNEVDFSAIKTAVFMAMFVVFFYGFKYYFGKNFDKSISLERAENRYILYPLSLVLLATLLSNFFIIAEPYNITGLNSEYLKPIQYGQPYAMQLQTGEPSQISPFAGVPEVMTPSVTGGSAFLASNITIYNFEQYFALVFILLLSVAARLNFPYLLIITIASFYLALETENRSALVMMSLMCIYYLINKILTPALSGLFYKIVRNLIIIFPVLYLIVMFFFIDINILDRSLYARYSYIQGYFNSVHWYHIFLPISEEARLPTADMHNEVLEIFNATALLGLIGYYYFIYHQIKSFSIRYRMQSISLLLLIFVGATMTGNTTHMYLLAIFTYLIAFYVMASRKEKKLIDRSAVK